VTTSSVGDGRLRVLVATSEAAPVEVADPVVRALEAAGLEVRLADLGRVARADAGTLEQILRAVTGGGASRRLLRELGARPPEVTMGFDPAAVIALSQQRDSMRSMAPVVAVVPELEPVEAWSQTDADRYVTIDDEAAVRLADVGVPGDRILPAGPMAPAVFASAAQKSRDALRKKFRIQTSDVVLVSVEGLGGDATSSLALQLALRGRSLTTLFDAGNDRDAASVLRAQVPTLDMRAKLFGATQDAPLLWRVADVVVAPPTYELVARALILGARFVSLAPEGFEQEQRAAELEERGLGTTAKSALLVSSAIDEALALRGDMSAREGRDGAGAVADIASVVGFDRAGVLEESERDQERVDEARAVRDATAQAADDLRRAQRARMDAPASGLEDLGGDGDAPAEDDGSPDIEFEELARLKAEVSVRMERAQKRMVEAQQAAESWAKRRTKAEDAGDGDLARAAERKAEEERMKMHAALRELAQLEEESRRIEKTAADRPPRPKKKQAPRRTGGSGGPRRSARPPRSSVDEELNRMKNKSSSNKASLDDELAELKRKMRKGR